MKNFFIKSIVFNLSVSCLVNLFFLSAYAGQDQSTPFLGDEEQRNAIAQRLAARLNKTTSTADSPELIEEFCHTFTNMLTDTLSDQVPERGPLQVPRQEIPADTYFMRGLNRIPKLKLYAERLSQTLLDQAFSRTLQMKFTIGSIEDEIKGKIPVSQGFAIDYIPSDDLRKPMLQCILEQFRSLLNAYNLDKNHFQNTSFDYTCITHLESQFKQRLKCFKLGLDSYEDHLGQNLSSEAPRFVNRDLLSKLRRENDLFVRQLILDSLETELQLSSLYLPLINLLFSDKNTHRCLKNQSKGMFTKLQDLLKEYEEVNRKMVQYRAQWNNDLYPPQKNPAIVSTTLASSSSLKANEEGKEKQRPSSTNKKKRRKNNNRFKNDQIQTFSALENNVGNSTNTGASTQENNYLQEWVFQGCATHGNSENLKSEFSTLSAQELREKRKEEAKTLKKEATGLRQIGSDKEEDDAVNDENSSTEATSSKNEEPTSESSKTSIHNPHKFGLKRLRPYHVTSIKKMFESAGYTLETVEELREGTLSNNKFVIRGGITIFTEIMTETYNGGIEPIETLVKNRFGGKVYRNDHNRWHFALPHITKNNNQVFWSLTGPRNNKESELVSQE